MNFMGVCILAVLLSTASVFSGAEVAVKGSRHMLQTPSSPPPSTLPPPSTSPPPASTASPPPPSAGTCGTQTYTFNFNAYTCQGISANCGSGGYTNSSGPGSSQAFTDVLGGKFSSLTATLSGQSYSNPTYPFKQDFLINGKSFGGFPALGGTVMCSGSCSTKSLVPGTQSGYKVGGSNTFSLPSSGNIAYNYNGVLIYTFYFYSLTITVTTSC
jgi:hypothetical protein